MLSQPRVDSVPSVLTKPGNLLAPPFGCNSNLSYGLLGASHRGDLACFRQANKRIAARRSTIRCAAEIQKSVSALTEKMKSLTGLDKTDTVAATVRILNEGLLDGGSHAMSDLMGQKVKISLVSLHVDPETKEPKLSTESHLIFQGRAGVGDEKGDTFINMQLSVPKDFGKPGAILIDSQHPNEFFLKSITLQLPDATEVYFPCHSWITESKLNFHRPRVFFSNQAYLPNETPPALAKYRQEDLKALRGDAKGERKEGERVYDYDLYNDLGNPDKKRELRRPVLGGSAELPYPRRCRTGRKPTKSYPEAEEPESGDSTYLPRDERFSPKKRNLFYAAAVRCFGHTIVDSLEDILDRNDSFERLEHIYELYVGELRSMTTNTTPYKLRNPFDGTVVDFPPPGVVQANTEGWRSDYEFGRQRLAGCNPILIERLKEFPPVSSLDPEIYGQAKSSITKEDLKRQLRGLTVEEAMEQKRLYILDYHDALMPYVNKINELDAKIYASRTIFFLVEDAVLLPIAIELTLPPKRRGDKAISQVFTPKIPGLPNWPWRLAKTHVAAVDSGIHELISHWLRTHACVEPFIIATHRQLSSMHPVNVLLRPHFKDTMNINALARTTLINAGGIIEQLFSPGKYSGDITSAMYEGWRFDEQALPKDLLKRGMAEEDASSKHGLKLHIEDYPFAADGLELWAAIKQWVKEYLAIYYKGDEAVRQDTELQSWWDEVQNVGHGDHAKADWWGEMKSVTELEEALTTLIWVTSGHHAAVNFGQYAYVGFMPNSPPKCRKLIPQEGSPEYAELTADPGRFYLDMISTEAHSRVLMSTVELLAQHMEEEEYLGERNDTKWSGESKVLAAFENFRQNLTGVEAQIEERNGAYEQLFHRAGPVLLPYSLLIPSSDMGLTFRGVPNSISI